MIITVKRRFQSALRKAVRNAVTTIKLWDVSDQRELATLSGHTSKVHTVAFSPDGRTLASGGNDGTIRLWNLLLHQQVAVLQGHTAAIWKVAFSPDGRTLASGRAVRIEIGIAFEIDDSRW